MLLFKKTPKKALCVAINRMAIMVRIVKMAIIAGLENDDMAINMVIMGVFSKSS